MIAWWLATLAAAAPLAGELDVTSTTAFEMRPDLDSGQYLATFGQRLGVGVRLEEGWHFGADGGLRVRRPTTPYDLAGDLWRATLSHSGVDHHARAGRLVRLDVRGFQRLDGVSVDYHPEGVVAVSGWAGRLWTPTTWDTGDTVTGGVQMHVSPIVRDGFASPLLRLTAGWEGRHADGRTRSRFLGAVSTRGATGAHGMLLVEGETGSDARLPVRAEVSGGGPAGRTVDLSARVAWHGLDHAAAPGGVATPYDLLTDDGYGLATAAFTWRSRGWRLDATAGATAHVQDTFVPELGGVGRAGFGWRGRHLGAGAFGHGAAIGPSWFGGGGLVVDGTWDRGTFTADTAWYRFRPLDGDDALVWELRGRGTVRLARWRAGGGVQRLALVLDAAGGTDRQLAPWIRGGLAVRIDAHSPFGRRG